MVISLVNSIGAGKHSAWLSGAINFNRTGTQGYNSQGVRLSCSGRATMEYIITVCSHFGHAVDGLSSIPVKLPSLDFTVSFPIPSIFGSDLRSMSLT
jgi:hypothetical protein